MRLALIRVRSPIAAIPSAIAVALVACTGTNRAAAPRVERETVGDTVFVHNYGAGNGAVGTLELDLRIGGDSRDQPVFTRITALAADVRGDVYVADDRSPLQRFGANGELLGILARQGAGPGEIQYVTGMSSLPGGGIATYDLGNTRVTLFWGPDDSVVSWRIPMRVPTYGQQAIAVDSSYVYVGFGRPAPADGGPERFPRPAYTRYDLAGQVLDTVLVNARFAEGCFPTRRAFRAGWFEDFRAFYAPKVMWAPGPHSTLIVGCPAQYSFAMLSPSGSVLVASLDRASIPVSDEELESFKKTYSINQSQSGYFEEWHWTGEPLPNVKPAYRKLSVAADGAVWVWAAAHNIPFDVPEEMMPPQVRRAGFPTRVWREPKSATLDVFAPDGQFRGSVTTPEWLQLSPFPDASAPFIRGDTVWAVATDSMDVQSVVRMHVRWRR